MTDPRHTLARSVAKRLAGVEGVVAVALGGSLARGTETPESDIDLGIYYRPEHPPARDQINALARELDDRHEERLVTAPGEWGKWANGGGWLEVDGHRVDWLLRDISRVAEAIEDCRAGRITSDFYLGHPHAFHNYIYLGEVDACVALEDPTNTLAALKALTATYPAGLREAVVRRFQFDARFMLLAARKPAVRGDVFQVSGCLFRVAAAIVQVLYALNEHYFLNEKGALAQLETFAVKPANTCSTLEAVLGRAGTTSSQLQSALERIERLLNAVDRLVNQHLPSDRPARFPG